VLSGAGVEASASGAASIAAFSGAGGIDSRAGTLSAATGAGSNCILKLGRSMDGIAFSASITAAFIFCLS
jgi:hypothetical protein